MRPWSRLNYRITMQRTNYLGKIMKSLKTVKYRININRNSHKNLWWIWLDKLMLKWFNSATKVIAIAIANQNSRWQKLQMILTSAFKAPPHSIRVRIWVEQSLISQESKIKTLIHKMLPKIKIWTWKIPQSLNWSNDWSRYQRKKNKMKALMINKQLLIFYIKVKWNEMDDITKCD